MKSLPVIAFLAALAAFLFTPVSLELAISFLLTLGLMKIVVSDYPRRRTLALPRSGIVTRKGKASPLPLAV